MFYISFTHFYTTFSELGYSIIPKLHILNTKDKKTRMGYFKVQFSTATLL